MLQLSKMVYDGDRRKFVKTPCYYDQEIDMYIWKFPDGTEKMLCDEWVRKVMYEKHINSPVEAVEYLLDHDKDI